MAYVTAFIAGHLLASFLLAFFLGIVVGYMVTTTAWDDIDLHYHSLSRIPGFTGINMVLAMVELVLALCTPYVAQEHMMGAVLAGVLLGFLIALLRRLCQSEPEVDEYEVYPPRPVRSAPPELPLDGEFEEVPQISSGSPSLDQLGRDLRAIPNMAPHMDAAILRSKRFGPIEYERK